MGESPDFDPLAPRLSRYRMGMDDSVAADAVQALRDLTEEMERRGRTLGAQPGRPPKVSRKLADRAGLGLHPLVLAIDECHELFQHKKYGKQAEELAVRLIKRGREVRDHPDLGHAVADEGQHPEGGHPQHLVRGGVRASPTTSPMTDCWAPAGTGRASARPSYG